MPLERIDHYLLQTTNLAATRDWYMRALGMREGPHPDFKFPVVQLFLKDPVNDVKVELSYANAEAAAAGIRPALTAAALKA